MSATTMSPVRHLLGLDSLGRERISELLDAADRYCAVAAGDAPALDTLRGRIIANLFFEDSTRTRSSFTVAAARLGARSLELVGVGSSLQKGETLVDTALNVEAMGVDAFVVRSAAAGGAALLTQHVTCPVINGGDGRHEHPTQGLLDLLTLRQRLGGIEGRQVAIVGDIGNSRVARSATYGLTQLGARVILVGPPSLVPKSFVQIAGGETGGHLMISHDLDAILPEIDAIMMLRVQFERGSSVTADYRQHYGLTRERADRLRPGAPVLHPGPMNRGLEIDGTVADDPERSVILAQVTNGVAVRMAVLADLLG